MARRSILVAIAVAAVALVPVSAQAATPGFAPGYVTFSSPVALQWTPTGALSEQLFRAAGACPQTGGTPVASSGGPGAPPSAASDAPGDGVYCYYVQDDPPLGASGTGLTVTVDTSPPTAGAPVPAFTGAPNYARGAIGISATSTDAATAVTDAFHVGGVACDDTSLAIASPWDTTAVADGTYTACNVATDGAGHTALSAGVPIIVDNTAPLGSVLTPAAGTAVGGIAVALTTDAADATAGVRSVQWRWTGTTGGAHNIGAAITNPANGFQRNWNTSTGNGHPPDGAVTISAIITDNAGNAVTVATPAVVDNTAPDVKSVVTAPPAVAGSPTLNWTAAHDAVGISRYDVLRGGNVIGSVPSVPGVATFSFNDKSAPDQATSIYVVRAYDGANHFADSAPVSVLVDSTALSAAKNVTAATPTAAAPVLNWQAPAVFAVSHYDVYRDGLLVGSTAGPAATFTDATAPEGAHDYAVLARDAASHPGVLSSSFKVVFDKTAPASGGAPTAQVLAGGQVNLAWPAARDSLSGVAGYIVRRTSGGTPPAAADGGSAVCAPTAPGCSDSGAGTGTSYTASSPATRPATSG